MHMPFIYTIWNPLTVCTYSFFSSFICVDILRLNSNCKENECDKIRKLVLAQSYKMKRILRCMQVTAAYCIHKYIMYIVIILGSQRFVFFFLRVIHSLLKLALETAERKAQHFTKIHTATSKSSCILWCADLRSSSSKHFVSSDSFSMYRNNVRLWMVYGHFRKCIV